MEIWFLFLPQISNGNSNCLLSLNMFDWTVSRQMQGLLRDRSGGTLPALCLSSRPHSAKWNKNKHWDPCENELLHNQSPPVVAISTSAPLLLLQLHILVFLIHAFSHAAEIITICLSLEDEPWRGDCQNVDEPPSPAADLPHGIENVPLFSWITKRPGRLSVDCLATK